MTENQRVVTLLGMPQDQRRDASYSSTYLFRDRLVTTLMQGQHSIVLLTAPAGYGKTTVLSQLTRTATEPVAWIRLRTDDAEVLTFAGHLIEALQQAFPHLDVRSWRQAVRDLVSNDGLRMILLDLLNSRDAVLVLMDQTEHLSADGWRWLGQLLDDLPPHCRVVLSGYDAGDLPTVRWVTEGRAALLGAADLAFTGEETRQYFQQCRSALDPQRAQATLEGWPLGLALAALGLQASSPLDLMFEVLDRLPPELRDAVAEAAPLDVWDEGGAAQLGCRLPSGWLTRTLRAGLPVRPLGGRCFEPHGLLVQALEHLLRARPERHRALHKAAAQRALADGQPLTALHHHLAAGHFEDAITLARPLTEQYRERYEFDLIRQVMERIGDIRLPPDLRVTLAYALLNSDAAQAETILKSLQREGYEDARLLHLLAVLEARRGRVREQIALARRGLTHPCDMQVRSLLLILLSGGLEDDGQPAAGLQAAEDALEAAELSHSLYALTSALSALAVSYARTNRREEARRTFDRAIALCERLVQEARWILNLNNYAHFLAAWGDIPEALDLAERGLSVARRVGGMWLPLLLGTRGLLYLQLGRFEQALSDLEEGAVCCPPHGLDAYACNYRLWAAQAAALLGEAGRARALLRQADAVLPAESNAHQNTRTFTAALLDFHAGRTAQARQGLMRLTLEHGSWEHVRQQAYLAEITRRQGQLTRAQLQPLLDSVQQAGHQQGLLAERRVLAGLFEECIRRRWSIGSLADLLPERSTAGSIELSLFTLGRFEAQVNGQQVVIPLRRSQELLVWLALQGSSTRAEVTRALWGEADTRHAIMSFKEALRRLRTALMQHPAFTFDPVVFAGGAYQLNGRLHVRVDAAQLQDSAAIGSAEILALYGGDFLPELTSEWVQDTRRGLQDRAALCAWREGQAREASDPAGAQRLFEQALRLNPYVEVSARTGCDHPDADVC